MTRNVALEYTQELRLEISSLYLRESIPVSRYLEIDGKSIDRDDMMLVSSNDLLKLLQKINLLEDRLKQMV